MYAHILSCAMYAPPPYIYNTVELLITDPPRSDHPLYNGQPLWNGLNLP